jgi:hypothetical protein
MPTPPETQTQKEELPTSHLLIEEHDAFLTGNHPIRFMVLLENYEEIDLSMDIIEPIDNKTEAPPSILSAKTGTVISAPAAHSTVIELPTAKLTPTPATQSAQKMDENGNPIIDIAATSIRELIDSEFSQGKISQAHIRLVEMKKNERLRKKQLLEKIEETPVIQTTK